MPLDWPTILSIATVLTGLYTAYSVRQKSVSEIFGAAMTAAKQALEMRDGDINHLKETLEANDKRMDGLVEYVEYITKWIRINYHLIDDKPLTYDEFLANKEVHN